MKFTIFNKNTGQIIQSGDCIDSDYDIQYVPNECEKLPIYSDPINQYIENGIVKDIPQKPEYQSYFDYQTKQWIKDKDAQGYVIKAKRNMLLAESDWTQLPDVPINTKTQWSTYRQELRDITSQPGYPFDVIWPTKPE